MTFSDLPLETQFPELNPAQITILKQLLKREYERGLSEIPAVPTITYGPPTPMMYTPNSERFGAMPDLNKQRKELGDTYRQAKADLEKDKE